MNRFATEFRAMPVCSGPFPASAHGLRAALAKTLVLCVLALLPSLTSAFGLKTHIWIGQQLLENIQASCRATIKGVSVSVNADVCASVRAHPNAFLSGVLGPDAFPDVITGQVTTHPGIEQDWQTNDWLIHMYAKSPRGPELAFAAGYVVHAASDVFAHSYVNAYSGDIFDLGDERAVERRHFLLEKYIDSRLPGFQFNANLPPPPAEFLRDKLLHHADAARQARKSGVALHVPAMYTLHHSVGDLANNLDRLERDAARLLAELLVTITEVNLKLATGEVQLKVAREALGVNEARLNVQQAVADKANAAFQKAVNDLQANKELINLTGLDALAAREAAKAARQVGTDAIGAAASLQNSITNLQTQVLNTPTRIAKEVCRTVLVKGACALVCPGGDWNPLCKNVCKQVEKTVCDTVDAVNDAYTHVTGQLNKAQNDLTNAQARVTQAGLDAAAHAATEASKLKEQATAAAQTAALDAAKLAAQTVHDVETARLKLELAATRESRDKADALAAEIAKLRESVVNAQAIKQSLADLIDRSDILSFYAKNWVKGMDIAGKEYILASHRISMGMLDGKSHFVSSYLEWWKCYGTAYTSVPVQLGQATCATEAFLTKIESEANKLVVKILPPPFNELFTRYLKLKADISERIKQEASNATVQFAKLVAPDATSGEFIELLATPAMASKDKMNAAFASTSDAAGKQLLVFTKLSDNIDIDMHLRDNRLDPDQFNALSNALTLSKLALLDTRAVKGLVWVLGGDPDRVLAPVSPGRDSVLFDMVRSIDGNQQWQPFGLPYARADGKAQPAEGKRRFGYGPAQARPGFGLFVDPELRTSVFLRLFDGPMNGELARHPLVAGKYPFAECKNNPFPVAFRQDGTAAPDDNRCAKTASANPDRSSLFSWRSIINRVRLNPYDPF
ncbi:zinc dependent phospholipase C family protein [Massilia scottii]|uniref:zinc dependent phospholipase C family protein n=1 Tax=Massilia scottii TaxID=3057166 RepID=UPI002796D362|nr:zinc dependent phospholipase C family protein [Massilia sp. CCM 9029]MDQ1829189.1 zinc dependent phospholipase C family protein [Massilia sp. CCM 9029]